MISEGILKVHNKNKHFEIITVNALKDELTAIPEKVEGIHFCNMRL